MADSGFREDQWRRRYEPHVEPINRFVDELGRLDDAGHPPYVAPFYSGVSAPALAILRDPGPRAGGDSGSGFLCVENNDSTAERQLQFFAGAGIDARDVVPWNAYPWYINAKPTPKQLTDGTEPLRRIIDLLPSLKVVLLLGGDARRAWKLFTRVHQQLIDAHGITALTTFHPGRQALWHEDPSVRQQREDAIRATLARAAVIMDSNKTTRS